MVLPARRFIKEELRYGVHNYQPLPVVLTRGRGAYVWDVEGRRYLDFLSAYSALNQGHNHPKIVAAARAQLSRLTLVSRAFHHDLMAPFLKKLCALTGQPKAIMMNSGAEAVETAIKAMRLWGYKSKGIPADRAKIIVCDGNFHGRTTTIVGFSSEPKSRDGFGPATPGFVSIPFGSASDLEAAMTPDTCGFLVEPIQGEAGIHIPPPGYLREIRDICRRRGVLLCLDEIQTGWGRTGRMFAADHEQVQPDLAVLGKALSGGLYPVSAVAGKAEVLDLFTPGTHGSTFGANPLACAIGLAALEVIARERLADRAARLGEAFLKRLGSLRHPVIKEIRGRGLLIGMELRSPARPLCEALLRRGLLAKETHETTVRLAPPLIITQAQLDAAFAILADALGELPPTAV